MAKLMRTTWKKARELGIRVKKKQTERDKRRKPGKETNGVYIAITCGVVEKALTGEYGPGSTCSLFGEKRRGRGKGSVRSTNGVSCQGELGRKVGPKNTTR